MSKATYDNKGFTLIELMIVIMLISLVTATVAPRLADQIQGARVRKGVRDFCNLCRLARSKAANEVIEYNVILDQDKKLVRLQPKNGNQSGTSLSKRKFPEGIRVNAVGRSGSIGGGRKNLV